ncbi:Kelch repeat-containing protein 3 [Basidiobolus ranarum]|uniref:Kelch repeat-containing protein 3 n=1 Tax=Basidiobolus ranarum TaxID=34480 RepID=A0ABR2W8S6_9FUNG
MSKRHLKLTFCYHIRSFDLKSSEWTKQEIKPLPPPRSGHRMTLWKHYLVLFGGFYDNVQTTRYYDDLWLFDTLEYKWIKVEFPENSNRPSPRSGFQLFPHGDNVFLYGGYCREFVKGGDAKGIVHSGKNRPST